MPPSLFTFVVYSGVDLGLINRSNIVSALCKRVKDQLIHKDLSFIIRTLKSEPFTAYHSLILLPLECILQYIRRKPTWCLPDGCVSDASLVGVFIGHDIFQQTCRQIVSIFSSTCTSTP